MTKFSKCIKTSQSNIQFEYITIFYMTAISILLFAVKNKLKPSPNESKKKEF